MERIYPTERAKLKPKYIAYAVYLTLTILFSLIGAAVPMVFLFFFAFQNLDPLLTSFGGLFADIKEFFLNIFTGILPQVSLDNFWFFVLIIPVGLFCYGVFLAALYGLFVLFRRAIPQLHEGFYYKVNGEWLLYEFYQSYYTLYSHFTWFLSAFLNARLLYMLFGARIGRGTIIGGGKVLTPDRLDVGENCIIGYGSLLCPHMYDGDRLYIKTIKIGDNVTVGGHAMVFAGVEIGGNSIIAANTVVGKDRVIPPNSVWMNGTAVPRKDMSAEEILIAGGQ
ncbi:MAG: acyltransferase [Promethearchaeota archaeon]